MATVTHVTTIDHVAKMLGEDAALLEATAVAVYLESEFAPGIGRILICHASDKTQTALSSTTTTT